MFTAAVFTAARTWKQPEYPSSGEWIKKIGCIYAVEYYSAIKRNEMVSFAKTQMNLETIIQNAVSQKDNHGLLMFWVT